MLASDARKTVARLPSCSVPESSMSQRQRSPTPSVWALSSSIDEQATSAWSAARCTQCRSKSRIVFGHGAELEQDTTPLVDAAANFGEAGWRLQLDTLYVPCKAKLRVASRCWGRGSAVKQAAIEAEQARWRQ